MYGEEDVRKIKREFIGILAVCGAFCAVMLTGFVFLVAARSQTAAVIEFIVWMFGLITVWALWLRPLVKYKKFIKRAASGVGLKETGAYIRVDDETTEIDRHDYKVLYFSENAGGRSFDRKVYFDTDKELPPMAEGARYSYKTLDNTIVGLESAE